MNNENHMALPSGKDLAKQMEADIRNGNVERTAKWLESIDNDIRNLQKNGSFTDTFNKDVKKMMKDFNDQLHKDGYLKDMEITGKAGGKIELINTKTKKEFEMQNGESHEMPSQDYGPGPKRYDAVEIKSKGNNYHDEIGKVYLDLSKDIYK